MVAHAATPVSLRELNRWTLGRQLLLERADLHPVAAVRHLVAMQAQNPTAPYIGLWSRLTRFDREELHAALADDRVVKATLLRGTLHLTTLDLLGALRVAAGSSYYDNARRRLVEAGADLDAIRAHVVLRVQERPHTRIEIGREIASQLPGEVPAWVLESPAGVSAVSVTTDLVNLGDDAAFGYAGGSRYRIAPATAPVDPLDALRTVLVAYLHAFGPASAADLSQWSGQRIRIFRPALDSLELVRYRPEDGPVLFDLPDGLRPDADTDAPVRFLPRWDNVLLAYARRERVLPEAVRKLVIAKNGDVAPTFLVDGTVAGTWDVPLKGPAMLTLEPLTPIAAQVRKQVEVEAKRLLAWLRPEADHREVRWS